MNDVTRGESPALSPELCDRLLYYAWRAPSPHNAQGWRIEVDGGRFRVSRDPARQVLRDFDPEGREGDLACGAVVTNLCVAARAFGFDAEVSWRPGGDVVADVTLVPSAQAPDQAIAVFGLGSGFGFQTPHPVRASAIHPGCGVSAAAGKASRISVSSERREIKVSPETKHILTSVETKLDQPERVEPSVGPWAA